MFFLDLPNIGTVRGKYNKIVDNLENITYWLMKIKKICNLTLQIAPAWQKFRIHKSAVLSYFSLVTLAKRDDSTMP